MKDFRARRWQQEDRNPMMTVFEKAGRYPDIIDLSIGDPDLKTPQKIIDLAFADAGAGHTKYTDPWGDPELREEIARFYAEEYGVALGEREIFVSTAGCVAMYLVMEAIRTPATRCSFLTRTFQPMPHRYGWAAACRCSCPAAKRTAGSRIWSALRSI